MPYSRTKRAAVPEDSVSATHVLIGGLSFPWAAKAPYVASGKSILGAIEYNEAEGLIKCHVCGKWMQSVGHHVRQDGVTPREYRRDFGLRLSSRLAAPLAVERRRVASQHLQSTSTKAERVARLRAAPRGKTGVAPGYDGQAEVRNLRSLCYAQIRARVLALGVNLGGTPTRRDCRDAGITPKVISATFQMSYTEFIKSLGFTPNRKGGFHKRAAREPIPESMRRLA